MSNKTPFFLLLALATASLAYLLFSSRRSCDNDDNDNEDDEPGGFDELHLTHDDVSDDVTVQVRNGRSHEIREDVVDDEDLVESKIDDDDDNADVAIEGAGENNADADDDACFPCDASNPIETPSEQNTKQQQSHPQQQQQDDQELIRQEALKNASQIIQSMPEIPLVHECLREVEAAESLEAVVTDSRGMAMAAVAMDSAPTTVYDAAEKEQSMDIDSSNMTTIHEEQSSIPIATIHDDEPTATKKKKYPKTPPVKLHEQDDEDDAMEPPTDTTDYSVLSSYWKKKSEKHVFSPPIVAALEATATVNKKKESPTTKEENAAAAAAAGLVVAGVVNVLDHVLMSPVASSSSSSRHDKSGVVEGGTAEADTDNMEEDMPSLDVSMMDDAIAECALENDPTKDGTGADSKEPRAEDFMTSDDTKVEEEEDTADDHHLILPSGSDKSSAESDHSSSEKSTNDDYVKIVKMASGDPMTESELFARPVEVVAASSAARDLGRVVESEGTPVSELEGGSGKSAAVVLSDVAPTFDKSDETTGLGKDQEELDADVVKEDEEESPQKGHGKSKSKKKKRGKKK